MEAGLWLGRSKVPVVIQAWSLRASSPRHTWPRPCLRPGPGVAPAGGGASVLPAPGFFPLVGGGSSPEADWGGGGGGGASGPPGVRGCTLLGSRARAVAAMQPPPPGPLSDCLRDWEDLQHDFQGIQETHRLYRLKLEELTKLQNNCTSSITRQKKRLQELALVLKKCKPSLPSEAKEAAQELENQMKERQGLFFDMEAYLPKKNGLYLSLVLGNVNVTLLSKQAKFAYKDEYEKFKLYITIILILISFTCRFLLNSRVTDAAFNFLLVWYYCTLTIRESILINNGSRIKGWWVFHHYVSTFLSGVMLMWPDGPMYQKFRNQFLSFSMYQSFVQFLQYYYQSGCLDLLRALGERHTMDLTVEGFQSWMWRGLTFLLPFLFFGHFWQLFNALTLFNLARDPQCKEWQVLMCGFPFLLLFLGNFFTTLRVVHQKLHSQQHRSKKE
ncbi:transmembrane protein 120A [Tupaia chinensis]|uniref:transmembrane protein 120A n=1 Tax=Tupaia chinensis TaxID=246437 RepID=UPI0003C8E759|nr:transmembrane protein 120A [Tupaia chinensis]XP_027630453.1 transmembrane protein 120A [Tupaia chinensis]